MTTKEALTEITSRGFDLTIWRLRGMIERGEVSPPRRNSSLNWDWTATDIENVVAALQDREKANSSA